MTTVANDDKRTRTMRAVRSLVMVLHLAMLASPCAFAASLDTTKTEAFAADQAHCAWFEQGGQVEPDAATVATQLAWATVQDDLQGQHLSPSAAVQVVAKLCGWSAPAWPAAQRPSQPARRPAGAMPLGSKARHSSAGRS